MMYYSVCDRGLARSERWDVKFLGKVVNKIDSKEFLESCPCRQTIFSDSLP